MTQFTLRSTQATHVSWDATTPDLWMEGSTLKAMTLSGTRELTFSLAGTSLNYAFGDNASRDTTEIEVAGRRFDLRDDMLDRLEDGHSVRILGGSGGFTGDSLTLIKLDHGSGQKLLAAVPGQDGFYTLERDGAGWSQQFFRPDFANTYASMPTAIATFRQSGRDYVITADGAENGVTTWELDHLGRLYAKHSLGQNEGFGLRTPTVMRTVQIDGKQLVIVGGAGTDSLSVLELGAGGSITPLDHVIDSRDTRFAGITVLETAELNGMTYVVAGGSDDGLTAFTLLPDGRLIEIATIADSNGASLNNVNALELHVADGRLHVFATSETEAGVTHLLLDVDGTGRLRAGGNGNDQITGTAGNDVIVDGNGGDTLRGGAGNDLFVLDADGDSDIIADFELGRDSIDLGAWDGLTSVSQLTITSLPNGARITYRGETLTIQTSNGASLSRTDFNTTDILGLFQDRRVRADEPDQGGYTAAMLGSDEDDTLTGGSGDDTIAGEEGDDLLLGLDGSDILFGGGGRDTLMGGGGADTLNGGDGDDRLEGGDGDDYLWASTGHDIALGGAGRDSIHGWSGDDVLSGGDDDDRLEGDAGNDRLFGDAGKDTLIGGEGNDLIEDTEGRTIAAGREGDDRILTGDGDDVLYGNEGRDTIWARGGDDRLYGGADRDVIDGGWGDDRLHGEDGDDDLRGNVGRDTISGDDGDDRLDGGDDDDVLDGGSGNDRIYGGNGNDRLMGSSGNDRLYGQNSNDTLIGGSGDDYLRGGSGRDLLLGEAGDDTLRGGSFPDRLEGGSGDDRLYASGARDSVYGDSGEDSLFGDDDRDHLVGGRGDDLVIGYGGDDRLYGESGDDRIYGSTGDDTIWDGSGDDRVYGGTGADRFIAGPGDDLMHSGGGGRDVFVFDRTRPGDDTIQGFDSTDTLILSRELVGGAYLTASVIKHRVTDTGDDLVIDLREHGSITIENVSSISVLANGLELI